MKSFLRLLGRMGLVIILFSSTFIHLNYPQKFVPVYQTSYGPISQLAQQNSINLPPIQSMEPYWKIFAKVIGLIEGVCGLLIFFGDHLGAALYLVSLLAGLFIKHNKQILSVLSWSKAQHLQLSNIVLFIGLALAMFAYQRQVQKQEVKEVKQTKE